MGVSRYSTRRGANAADYVPLSKAGAYSLVAEHALWRGSALHSLKYGNDDLAASALFEACVAVSAMVLGKQKVLIIPPTA